MHVNTNIAGHNKLLKVPIDTYRSNNRPPIGVGSYRLSIDLEPIVQGCVLRTTATTIQQEPPGKQQVKPFARGCPLSTNVARRIPTTDCGASLSTRTREARTDK